MKTKTAILSSLLVIVTTLFLITPPLKADVNEDLHWFTIYSIVVENCGDNEYIGDVLRERRAHFRDRYLSHTYDFSASPWVTPEVREAWVQGYTGRGVTIEIRDDFQGTYSQSGGRRYYWPAHGELVQLIISGGRLGNTTFTGIAPDATIIRRDKVTGQYTAGVDIVNESNSSQYRCPINSADIIEQTQAWWDTHYLPFVGTPLYENRTFAHLENLLVIKSAGNRGADTCLPGGYCTDSSLTLLRERDHAENAILVGALRFGNNISTKAGVTRDSYVVDTTRYELVWDEDGTRRQMRFGGASAAVPTVTGKAALIRSKFPTKTGPEVATLIQQTARDLGVSGVDDHWGNGQVNLTRALLQGEPPSQCDSQE